MSEPFDQDLRAAYAPRLNSDSETHQPDCPSVDALHAALRGEGAESERLLVLDRALRCAACRRELALLHAVSQGAEAQQKIPNRWSWQRMVPLAAAASVVLVAGVIGIAQLRQTGEQPVRALSNDQPVLIAPVTNASANTRPVTFAWHPTSGALRYILELTASDGTVLFSTSTTDTTAVALTSAAGAARWWVRAHMDDGSERRSETRVLRLNQ